MSDRQEQLMNNREDDLAHVRSFKLGNNNAFNYLVRKYSQRLFNTIVKMVKNEKEAEDLLQDTFLKAYGALNRFREESSFYTWIYRIAVNLTLNFLKIKKRSIAILDQDVKSDKGSIKREIADWKMEPGAKIEQSEMMEMIEKALGGISEKNRVVFVMREIDGLSYPEIAETLEVTEQTVRTRLFRAKKDLKDVLEDYVHMMKT